MKMDDNVPNTTPRIIANEKLRILSPPKKKIHNNTISVDSEVLMVRVRVWFSEALNKPYLSRFLYRPKFSRIRSNTTTLSLME